MRTLVILAMSAWTSFAQQTGGRIGEQGQPLTWREEVSSLEAQLTQLRKTYSESHPSVVALERKLALLRSENSGVARVVLPARWWKNPETARYVGLTADQQKRMDDVFQKYRFKLIDLSGALEKEELTMEPLVGAAPLDQEKITIQIDRVAEARADLERANGRMLLEIRKLLSPAQWAKLNERFSFPLAPQ
jgi:hypothetical protein